MGNELSTNKEVTQNGKVPEKHENGSVNGVSANITSNGLEINVNSETVVQQNGEPLSLNLSTESAERDFVVVKAAPVASEAPEPEVPKEEVKKKKPEKASLFGKMFKKKEEPPAKVESVEKPIETPNEDQTDACPPAADLQPELNQCGEEAASMIINEHQVEMEYLHQTAEMSTQTDETEVNISTQTCDDDDDAAEQEVVMESATTEDPQDKSAVIVAEEATEVTGNEDDITAGVMYKDEVITEYDMYENTVFKAERVRVTGNFGISHCHPEELCLADTSENDGVTFEAAIDLLSQELEPGAAAPQESAIDVASLPKEEVINATVFVALCGEHDISLPVPEDPADVTIIPPKEETVEDMSEEAIEALSNEFEAKPVRLEEDTAVQESEPVKDNDITKKNSEKQCSSELCPCEDDAAADVLGNTPESDNEAHSVSENVAEESEDVQTDVPPVEVTEESEHWVSDREEENIAPAEDSLEDPVDDVESSESTDPDSAVSEEPVEESELPKTKEQVIIFLTDEYGVTEEITNETDGSGVVAADFETDAFDEIEILDEPEAKYIHVLLETIVEDLIAEEAEGEPVTSEEVGPEIAIEEQRVETESRENTADSATKPKTPEMNETTSVTSMNLEVLRNQLHSACQSVVEESLVGLETRFTITITITVAPRTKQ